MSVNPSSFGPKPQFIDGEGNPAVGNQLFFYTAGSATKQNTYTDSTGNTANANPLVLNALGQPTNELWFTDGASYKVIYAAAGDTDPPASPIWTIDNISGINDNSNLDQWIGSGVTPTYISTTQFTLVGDQTTAFHVNRRVRCSVTAGTVYGYISVSAYTTLTTVTVVPDSGALDVGLDVVDLGLLTATDVAFPKNIARSGANTDITSLGNLTSVGTIGAIGTITGNIPATGNFVPAIDKGIDFSANASGAGMQTELFNDYEGGAWTPVAINLTVVGSPTYTGWYVKVGSLVFGGLRIDSTTSTASTAGSTYFTGFPFVPTDRSPCVAAKSDGSVSDGVGIVTTDPRVYTPTWAATASTYVSFVFRV
jgi:hypothetical protein